MIFAYKTSSDGILEVTKDFEINSWLNITSPSKEELEEVSLRFNIPMDFLQNPLDLEESARIEYDKDTNCTLITIDFPIIDVNNNQLNSYITIPIGIIIGTDYIMTVCNETCPFLDNLIKANVNSNMRSRLAISILSSISTEYLNDLKQLNKQRIRIESNLRDSLTNRQLFDLMEIEKSLIYFLTSLKSNDDVIKKLIRTNSIKLYEDDKELLDELIIENTQAIETTELYTRILDSITDSYSSLISNEMNNTVKTLTVITVFFTIPTLIFSFFGMNVPLPLTDKPTGWVITLLISLFFGIWVAAALLRRKIL
ncbi:magnesium transporter CorA family protein [Paenibacillus alvei]|uniref:magnesium transporter CorA family protein n=1 Tax=Paenibacillus alvei TaxID=44250 RepID=UPI002281B466|nr:magnesium transporter CorA family protein [Paenibacillus alvei]